MRAVAQRVSSACIRIHGSRIHESRIHPGGVRGGGDGPRETEPASLAEMGAGLLVLVGVGREDGPEDAERLARRLVALRVFEDEAGRMNRSLVETGGTLGVVSQFTLYGDVRRGNRPSFGDAAPPEQAEPLVEAVVEAVRRAGVPVVTGRFRSHMEVSLVNDGPVTLWLDTALSRRGQDRASSQS